MAPLALTLALLPQRRIELLQDFAMPTASTRIVVSPDAQYVLVAGTYKPRVRVYDTRELGIKFERHFGSEVANMCCLADDYSKLAFLHVDRYVEFHSRAGFHYRTRIPKFGRDMCYHRADTDLYIAAHGPEMYRLNMERGQFLRPLPLGRPAANVCALNPCHGLVAAGTTDGGVVCFDPRVQKRVGVLDVVPDNPVAVTALSFHPDGLTMAVGGAAGCVRLYDIRARAPLFVKDHNYGFAIKRVCFHKSSGKVVSCDKRAVRIWEPDTGANFAVVEPQEPINDVCIVGNSGLFFCASESEPVLTYFIPSLGPAPRWCSYLDTMTEEAGEDDAEAVVYDDYKFITRDELEQLGMCARVCVPGVRA